MATYVLCGPVQGRGDVAGGDLHVSATSFLWATLIVKHRHPAKRRRIELISMIAYNNHGNNCNMRSFVRENDTLTLRGTEAQAALLDSGASGGPPDAGAPGHRLGECSEG